MLNIKSQTTAIVSAIVLTTIIQSLYLKGIISPTVIEPVPKQATTRFYIDKDSIGWRLIKEFPGAQPGQGTMVYDRYPDSISLVQELKATIRFKEALVKADAYTGEIAGLNRLLSLMTKTPDASLPATREDLAKTLPGKWVIISGKDSLRVTVNTFLVVSGPGIEGAIEAVDNKSVTLKKVLPADTRFEFTAPGTLSGDGVVMRKD